MTISTLEGLVLVGLAVGVGPLVAREAIGLLGYTPAFEGLTDGARLSVELTGEAYIWAAIGAALSFVALILAGLALQPGHGGGATRGRRRVRRIAPPSSGTTWIWSWLGWARSCSSSCKIPDRW